MSKGRQFPVAAAITLEGFFWATQFLHVEADSGEETVEEHGGRIPIFERYWGSASPRTLACFEQDEGFLTLPLVLRGSFQYSPLPDHSKYKFSRVQTVAFFIFTKPHSL